MSRKKEFTPLLMIVFVVINFVLSLSGTLFSGILDHIAQIMQISVADTGSLTSFYAYGAIGAPVLILVLGSFKRETLLKGTLLFTLLFGILSIYAQSFPLLLFARLMSGLFATAYNVLATTTIATLSSSDKVGRNIALLISGASASLMVGVPLCRILIEHLTWQTIYLILVIFMTIGLVSLHVLLPDMKTHGNTIHLKKELGLLFSKNVLSIVMISFIAFVGYGSFYTYLTPYLVEMFPQVEQYTSLLLVLVGAFALLGNYIGGIFCDKIGFRKALLFGIVIQLVIGLLIFMTRQSALINIAFIMIWMFVSWFIGLQLNTGINIVTQNKSSFLVSLNGSIIQFSQAVGASIAAMVITHTGIPFIVFVSVFASVLGIVLSIATSSKKADQTSISLKQA